MADALSGIRAYAAAARQIASGAGEPAAPQAGGADFGSLVVNAVRETEAGLATAEAMTQQAAVGRAELVDVATAIAAAEVSLETVVTLRDQVVQAYQEILRMPI
jgi:flagellar hook-basal body complex protein FliE